MKLALSIHYAPYLFVSVYVEQLATMDVQQNRAFLGKSVVIYFSSPEPKAHG